MKFLYRKYPAKKKEVIELKLDRPARSKFMTAAEFKKYVNGRTHTYFNGHGDDALLRFTVPFDGVWHVVVERGLNGEMVDVSANCRLCLPEPEESFNQEPEQENLSSDDAEVQAISFGSRSEG